ncbi:hypothetical protein [Crenobacter intestini]|uniref:Uncharacterized protein n=1 Tax=Crenobacter intestini TaxID=2563443 RepID=A0A4T0UIY5_9NEIS|nr:hypothetical protein [Crenobacter intestini]TIC78480.1 hypothetical protein E5K04_16005 [Crenobacter intestini]
MPYNNHNVTDNNFAVQLVRYPSITRSEEMNSWENYSLDDLRQWSIEWLTSSRVLTQAQMETHLFFPHEIDELQRHSDQIKAEITRSIEQSPFWMMLAEMYRYAVQGDGELISQVMESPAQDDWGDKVVTILNMLGRVQAGWNEMPPYAYVENVGAHTGPGHLLALRFLARLKLDFPRCSQSELISGLSCHFSLPEQGLSLPELAVLSGTTYGRIKSLTASHKKHRGGLLTTNAPSGVYVIAALAKEWLKQEPGFLPSSSIKEVVLDEEEAPHSAEASEDPALLEIDELDLQHQTSQLSADLYALNFCLIDQQGTALFAVRMSKRGEKNKLFRLSEGGAGGNLLENTIYVATQEEAKQKVLEEDLAIRATSADKSRTGLYKLSGRSIVAAYDFTEKRLIKGENK